MADIVLQPGVHTAKFTYTPPAGYVGLNLNAQLYLSSDGGVTPVTPTPAPQNFQAATGGNSFTFSVTVPTTPGVYKGYIAIDDGAQFLVGFADTNNIVVGGGGSIGPISYT